MISDGVVSEARFRDETKLLNFKGALLAKFQLLRLLLAPTSVITKPKTLRTHFFNLEGAAGQHYFRGI